MLERRRVIPCLGTRVVPQRVQRFSGHRQRLVRHVFPRALAAFHRWLLAILARGHAVATLKQVTHHPRTGKALLLGNPLYRQGGGQQLFGGFLRRNAVMNCMKLTPTSL